MAPADARADTGPGSRGGSRSESEDTLDLRLTEELMAFIRDGAAAPPRPDAEAARQGEEAGAFPTPDGDLLDSVENWAPVTTAAGVFRLVPVKAAHDVELVARWMNDPVVAVFWELDGPPSRTAEHVRGQLEGDGRSVPALGTLDGVPMSYWEIYRADLDPLARHYPARLHDTGIHLLVGGAADRGRGLGSALLDAVAGLVLAHRPACGRVVAEPDVRNAPSVAAFLKAGFRRVEDLDLPDKRAALMVRDRSPRPPFHP